MIDPGVKAEKGYFVYDSEKINAWVMTKTILYFLVRFGQETVFPDFTQSKVSKWWGELYENFMAKGVDGVWNDMNEPAVFETEDWTMPDSNKHLGDENIKNDIHLRYHNVYGMMMVESSEKESLNLILKKDHLF